MIMMGFILSLGVSRARNTWALLIETRLAAVAATCPLVSKMATQNDANKKPAKPHILTVSRPLRLEDDFYEVSNRLLIFSG